MGHFALKNNIMQELIKVTPSRDWLELSDNEKISIYEYYKEKNMLDKFQEYISLSHEELEEKIYEVDQRIYKIKFENYLARLQNEYFQKEKNIFPNGYNIETTNGDLYLSEYFIDTDEIDNYKEVFGTVKLFGNLPKKDDYYSLNISNLKFIFENVKKPIFKKGEKTIYTYLMTDSSGYIKIGKAEDIYKRFVGMRIGNPTLKIIAKLDNNIERKLHNKYSLFNFHGEWFSLSKSQIDEIINNYNFKRV